MSKAVDLLERFWPKVNKDGPTPTHCPELGPCWIWTAATASGGYGAIGETQASGKNFKHDTHRLSWQLHNGPIPKGVWVLHKCDIKGCVNPNHLYLGSARQNAQDAINRGQKKVGTGCSFAKLNKDQVELARELNTAGFSQPCIAELFGVSQGTIFRAISGGAYRDVPLVYPYQKGHKNQPTKLTEAVVREIRATPRTWSNRELAQKYGVGITTIHNARIGESWCHVI